jgi:hypothetical protein
MSWEKDMSAAAMMGEPLQSVTAENTWHGFGSERTEVLPFDEMVAFCLGNAVDGGDSVAAKGKRRSPLVTPAELLLVTKPHGNPPLFSAAELGPLVEFFRGGDAD